MKFQLMMIANNPINLNDNFVILYYFSVYEIYPRFSHKKNNGKNKIMRSIKSQLEYTTDFFIDAKRTV